MAQCVCKQTIASFLSQIRQSMYVQCNIQVRSCNHCCPRKAVSITHSECVSLSLALVIQDCKVCAPYYVICGLSGTVIFYHTISQTAHFRKNSTEYKMSILIFFTTLSEIFFILIQIEWDTIINVHWYSCQVPINLVRF